MPYTAELIKHIRYCIYENDYLAMAQRFKILSPYISMHVQAATPMPSTCGRSAAKSGWKCFFGSALPVALRAPTSAEPKKITERRSQNIYHHFKPTRISLWLLD